jgi:hypothetical protein
MEYGDNQKLEVLFDPGEFSRTNPGPIRREYQLENDALREWAMKTTEIRKKFRNKAELYGRNIRVESLNTRSRDGQ